MGYPSYPVVCRSPKTYRPCCVIKSHLFQSLFKKNGFFAVSGTDQELELTTSSALGPVSVQLVFFPASIPMFKFTM